MFPFTGAHETSESAMSTEMKYFHQTRIRKYLRAVLLRANDPYKPHTCQWGKSSKSSEIPFRHSVSLQGQTHTYIHNTHGILGALILIVKKTMKITKILIPTLRKLLVPR